jgi:hypothetical protein
MTSPLNHAREKIRAGRSFVAAIAGKSGHLGEMLTRYGAEAIGWLQMVMALATLEWGQAFEPHNRAIRHAAIALGLVTQFGMHGPTDP